MFIYATDYRKFIDLMNKYKNFILSWDLFL